MNLNTAAHYLQNGYRIRRPSWKPHEYVYSKNGILYTQWEDISGYSSYWSVLTNELLADDWELITVGVVTHFPLKYEDEE